MKQTEQALTAAMGERLRAARHARRLSLSELSALTGNLLSKSRISNYEQGLRRMSIEAARTLAEALEIVSPAYLLGLEQDRSETLAPDELALLWKFRRLDEDWRSRVLAVAECMPRGASRSS